MTTACDDFLTQTTPHLSRLFRVGMRLTHQASEAQDLVQEALMKAWANWHRYQPGGSLGAWLSRILVNTFISRHRHQRVVDVTATGDGRSRVQRERRAAHAAQHGDEQAHHRARRAPQSVLGVLL